MKKKILCLSLLSLALVGGIVTTSFAANTFNGKSAGIFKYHDATTGTDIIINGKEIEENTAAIGTPEDTADKDTLYGKLAKLSAICQ